MGRKPKYKEEDRELIEESIERLRNEGKTFKEISLILGCISVSSVRNICVKCGLDKTEVQEKKRDHCRALRFNGWKYDDIAKEVKVSYSFVSKACSDIQIVREYPELSDFRKHQHDDSAADWTNFFKSCGYKNIQIDSRYITGDCCICGSRNRFFKSTSNRNRGSLFECKACKKEKRIAEIEENKKAEQEWKKKQHETFKLLTRVLAEMEREAKREAKKHECPVCGTETTNRVYCSEKCRKKAHDANHAVKRRIKLRNAMVNSNITLERLYKRDMGICHICGERCDYNDYEVRDGQFISGRNYPSIDHVVPLAKGGAHSWENVKLAHHYCNTIKSDRT